VPDQEVRETAPIFAGNELHQIALDLDGIFLSREGEPLR
jgi:hypothetical protein